MEHQVELNTGLPTAFQGKQILLLLIQNGGENNVKES